MLDIRSQILYILKLEQNNLITDEIRVVGKRKQSIITLEFWTIATWLMFIFYLNKSISSILLSPMIAFKRKWEERYLRQKIQIISKSLAGKGEQKGGLAARGK